MFLILKTNLQSWQCSLISLCQYKLPINQNQEVDEIKCVEFCQEDRIKYLEGDQGDKEVNNSVDKVKYCSWEANKQRVVEKY